MNNNQNTIMEKNQKTVEKEQPKFGKSGAKICCSCPDTKEARDLCILQYGEDKCKKYIEAHKQCLRAEGFTVD